MPLFDTIGNGTMGLIAFIGSAATIGSYAYIKSKGFQFVPCHLTDVQTIDSTYSHQITDSGLKYLSGLVQTKDSLHF